MVDEPVGLVVVAVAVDVVAVLDVEGLQVVLDLGHRLAALELVVHPHGHGVTDERLRRGAGGDRGAERRAAVAATVERLVVGHLDPLGDVAVDAVATRGLGLVVLLHPVEVHVLVVLAVEVLLPDGGVVLRPVGLGDLVVQRAVERRRLRVGEIERRGVGEAAGAAGGAARTGVALVAELGEHDEDLVGAFLFQRDLLALRGALREGALAAHDALEGRLPLRVPLLLDRERVLGLVSFVRALVRGRLEGGLGSRVSGSAGVGDGRRAHEQSGGDQAGGRRECCRPGAAAGEVCQRVDPSWQAGRTPVRDRRPRLP